MDAQFGFFGDVSTPKELLEGCKAMEYVISAASLAGAALLSRRAPPTPYLFGVAAPPIVSAGRKSHEFGEDVGVLLSRILRRIDGLLCEENCNVELDDFKLTNFEKFLTLVNFESLGTMLTFLRLSQRQQEKGKAFDCLGQSHSRSSLSLAVAVAVAVLSRRGCALLLLSQVRFAKASSEIVEASLARKQDLRRS
ncbi:hypothetical protein Scep_010273 [Stephania cephalantha]|uniref:Uncharacterized protein n=1 Tax=Stephania cephalantha TaxID=152367 RepID=A0AAP0JUT4_9MAGN